MEIEVKITDVKSGGGRASVSIQLPQGGFTVNRICIKETGGKLRITFPLSGRLHPYVTLRGELKRAVYGEIEEAYAVAKGRSGSCPVPEADL